MPMKMELKNLIYLAEPTGNQSGDCNLGNIPMYIHGNLSPIHSDNGRIATIYLEVEDKRFNYVNKITIKIVIFQLCKLRDIYSW